MTVNPFKEKISGSSPLERQQLSDQSGGATATTQTEQAVNKAQFQVDHSPYESDVNATPLRASEKAALMRSDRVAQAKKEQLERLSSISSLDWKNIPPPILAQLLTNMPFKGQSGEPDFYLEPWQAMVFAIRCFELELSPFSNEVWFNPKNNKVNQTFEGKLKRARMMGMNLSPPTFRRIPEDATKALVAYECTIKTPQGPCTYTATLKEWRMPNSPVWRDRTDHMLQLRAAEKCLSFATGSGASELMGEQDLQVGSEAKAFVPAPEVESTEFKEYPETIGEHQDMSDGQMRRDAASPNNLLRK
jgi:hypothetical protein